MTVICQIINAIVLIYGGIVDYKKREIPNLVPITLLLTGLFAGWQIIPNFLCMLMIALLQFAAAKLTRSYVPGGDFKLTCALTFSLGLGSFIVLEVLTGLCIALVKAISKIRKKNITSITLCSYVAPAYIAMLLLQIIFYGGIF